MIYIQTIIIYYKKTEFDRAGSSGLAQRDQKHLTPLTGHFFIEALKDYLMPKSGHLNPALSIPPDHLKCHRAGSYNL